MAYHQSNFVAAVGVRRVLVEQGDIRAEIEFQNDINGILARLDDATSTIEAVGVMSAAVARPKTPGLRIIRGGVARSHSVAAEPPQFLTAVARSA
jgi:hypothetical protein